MSTVQAKPPVSIRPAFFPQDHTTVSALFTAYAASLNIDLSFQSFEDELANLPGKYAEERGGALFLASSPIPNAALSTSASARLVGAADEDASNPAIACSKTLDATSGNHQTDRWSLGEEIVGCAALRVLSLPTLCSHTCELKRLYIDPDARGIGAGRALLEAVIQKARSMGYNEMLLDTLPTMVDAIKMYKAFSFEVVEKYYENPIEGTCYMRLRL